jgi:hypothetical protein
VVDKDPSREGPVTVIDTPGRGLLSSSSTDPLIEPVCFTWALRIETRKRFKKIINKLFFILFFSFFDF